MKKKHNYYKKIKSQKKSENAKLREEFGVPEKSCESCQQNFPVEKLIFGPCPFASEIYNDYTPTILCEKCYHEALMDI
jgi:Zn finger protein HypA/HybF involved in hydrogenase expression